MDLVSALKDEALRDLMARTIISDVPTFDEWVEKKKFKNPKTKKDVSFGQFEKINPEGAKKLRDQYNEKLKEHKDKMEGLDKSMPIKKRWLESKPKWEARVKQDQDDIDSFVATDLDTEFSAKVQKALHTALKNEPETLKTVEKVKPGTKVKDMDPASVRVLKKSLKKALNAFPEAKVAEHRRIFGDESPAKVLGGLLGAAKEAQKKVEKIVRDLEGKTTSKATKKLEAQADKLLADIEGYDKKFQEASKFVKKNADLIALTTHHSALIEAERGAHKDKLKSKGKKPIPVEVEEEPEEAPKPKVGPKKAPKPEAEKKEEPKKEEPKKEEPKKEEHKPGDVWGTKPKLYAMNPDGDTGGPFKGMNEAKRYSQGKTESEGKEKTKKEQQQAEKRRKKSSEDEMIARLASERVLFILATHHVS